MNHKYPIFIPTKSRFDSLKTIKCFEKCNIPYTAVIEAQEFDDYAKVVDEKKLLVVPHKDKGLTVTRNWIWDYAQDKGHERFWTFDDNIDWLYRLNHNQKIKVADGTIIRAIEDFTDRYENIYIAGMNYTFFCKQNQKIPPYYLNTRVYSNMLIKTDAKDRNGNPIRNETFYNDDTDLCLRVLKNGYCTVQFNAFLIDKATTMTVEGGMTTYYKKDGRLKFAQELVDKHPDVARVTWKFNRWHHQVDYSSFAKNKLEFKKNINIPDVVNNYGMVLKKIEKSNNSECAENN